MVLGCVEAEKSLAIYQKGDNCPTCATSQLLGSGGTRALSPQIKTRAKGSRYVSQKQEQSQLEFNKVNDTPL